MATVVSVPQLAVIDAGAGKDLELLVVTCVVVGGTAIRGGTGTIGGTLLAVLLLSSVRTMLVFLAPKLASVPALGGLFAEREMLTYWERAIQGGFILAAVLADHLSRRGGGAPAATAVAARPTTGFRYWHELVLAGLLVPLTGAAGWLDAAFFRGATQLELGSHVLELALVALPMTLILISGGHRPVGRLGGGAGVGRTRIGVRARGAAGGGGPVWRSRSERRAGR